MEKPDKRQRNTNASSAGIPSHTVCKVIWGKITRHELVSTTSRRMDSAGWINGSTFPALFSVKKHGKTLGVSICFNPKRASCMCFPVNRLREPYTSILLAFGDVALKQNVLEEWRSLVIIYDMISKDMEASSWGYPQILQIMDDHFTLW